jgi:ketosteroid isomerase-like protein
VARASDANKDLLRRILIAYGEGDLAPMRAALDPDVVYFSHGPQEFFRFGGRHEGFGDTIAALSAIASDYAVHRYQIRELIGEGEIVWLTAEVDATDRRRKTRLKITLAARWQFKGGRVISVEEYFDSG